MIKGSSHLLWCQKRLGRFFIMQLALIVVQLAQQTPTDFKENSSEEHMLGTAARAANSEIKQSGT